jgi:hypothetical protein
MMATPNPALKLTKPPDIVKYVGRGEAASQLKPNALDGTLSFDAKREPI